DPLRMVDAVDELIEVLERDHPVSSSSPLPPAFPEVLHDRRGGVASVRTTHAAAGMGPGAAQVEMAERSAVPAVAADRSQEEQLVGRHIAVHVMASGETEPPLQ